MMIRTMWRQSSKLNQNSKNADVRRRQLRARFTHRSMPVEMKMMNASTVPAPRMAEMTPIIQRNAVMVASLQDHCKSFQQEHGEEAEPRDHRPLDDASGVEAPLLLARADVHRKAQQARDEQEVDDDAEDRH